MDSMGIAQREILDAAVLSVLLSILASKRVVLNRQHGRNRLGLGSACPIDSAK
jgi:protein tyrosine/serine phosphatase